MNRAAPGYVAIEGPIGVGKTSLARRLAASFEAEAVFEEAEENPFLERFYRDQREAALPTQLSFLFQRTRKLEALAQSDLFHPAWIVDFVMEKDLLFAELTLDDAELALYHEVYRRVARELPAPELVIYLQAPVEVLLKRIAARGRSFERTVPRAYLERVVEAYTHFFHHYNRSRLLIVNAATADPVHEDADYERLLAEIRGGRGDRSYFNPEAGR
ncbi:MAG TPA: deoxynucleoside kinase [Gammaproteobacteria bacterium]|nr:deoxynucleoside kinase [Gammaproteobacteria bacterium]